MSTHRSFFSQFFATFRAHRSPTLGTKTSTTTGAVSSASSSTAATTNGPSIHQQQQQATFPSAASALTSPRARPIPTTKNASTAFSSHQHPQQIPTQQRQLSTSPAPSFGSSSHQHLANTASSSQTAPASSSALRRRSSDTSFSSTSASGPSPASPREQLGIGGFREVARSPFYIGGITATGEERFLRLGMVKGSEERLSLDRLSL